MAKEPKDDGVDIAALQAENEALKSAQAAQQRQNDQVLDALIDLQETVKRLKAGQSATPAVAQFDQEAELDAELDALKDEFKDYPAIEMLERRVLVGAEANNELRLTDEPGLLEDPHGTNRKWKLRWFNFAVEGRAPKATQEGYIRVTWAELRDGDGIGEVERKDDFVRQGDRGLEVLHKIPLKLFEYKKRRDAARHNGLLSSEASLRDHLSSNVSRMAAREGGNADQAGSMVHGKKFEVSITRGETERITA